MSFMTIFSMALCFSHFNVVILLEYFLLAILPYSDVVLLFFSCDNSPPCSLSGHSLLHFSCSYCISLTTFVVLFSQLNFTVSYVAVFTPCIQESKDYVIDLVVSVYVKYQKSDLVY